MELQKPHRNILFIQCDSMDGRVMGCMDHPAMTRATPNLDRLAKRGVMFRNAYSNNPICCPSRASMWSGQYTNHCEGWNNYKGLSEDTPTFRSRLDDEGYLTQTFGKTDYLSGYHTIRARISAWTRSAGIKRPNYRMDPPRIIERSEKRVQKADWNDIERSIAWMKEAATDQDKPFMLYLGIRAPHPDFITSRYYLDKINEKGVTVPPVDNTDHPVLEYQRINKNWQHGFSEYMVKQVRRVYFAMISEVDDMVGHLLDALDECGLRDSTYVIFTSDHGEMAMEHQQFYKMNLYEPSVRIPLIIAGPDICRGIVVDSLVSLVDIYPTLMDMAGVDCPEGVDGLSLMPELQGQSSCRHDWVLSEYHDSSFNTGAYMLRRGEWKYIAYVGFLPQLFNLREDPYEIHNLAEKRPDITREMDELLRKIVDYEAIDAKVKIYDKESFRVWRTSHIQQGDYQELMARVYSGWDNLLDDEIIPWSQEDEKQIEGWLSSE